MASFYRPHEDLLLEPYRIPSGVFFPESALEELPNDTPTTVFPLFPNARPRVIDNNANTPIISPMVNLTRNTTTLGNPPPDPQRSRKPAPSLNTEKILCLPLLDVAIDVRVDSTIAMTTFVQRFTNVSDQTILEAHYTFPMYDGAAVTSFRYYIGDSDVLVGKVLSKEEAMDEYLLAIEHLETAALLEEMTPEVFQTLIGNIPPKTSVKVEITYVSQLKIDIGGRGSLVTIPTSLAPRYGAPPARLKANSSIVYNGLAIAVAINSQEPIRQIECRSHPVSVEMGSAGASPDLHDFKAFYAQASSSDQPTSGSLNPRQATVRLCDPHAMMDKDFVVFIKTSEGDSPAPRSRALLSPPDEHGHAALMLTIQPSELFQPYHPRMDFAGEIVFLADRSGSMGGEKISGLRNALQVFIKSLPDSCTFNIYSFGSSFHSLWEYSRPYNQANLDEAAAHVTGFSADLGGTELLPALKDVIIRKSSTASSIQIIALTDGQIWNSNETIELVKQSRSRLGVGFRLFALGIGNAVSHRVIEGISEAGGGFGEVVGIATPDKWQDRVIRMLKGALMPPTWNCRFDLGSEFVRRDLYQDNFTFDPKADNRIALGNTIQSYIQATLSPSVHHFRQSSFFFLLRLGQSAPTVVTITANPGGQGDSVSVTLPVVSALSPETTLQHLAVKYALLNLELRVDQQQPADAAESSVASRNAVFLGKMYSITSRWTSFVATNHDGSVSRAIDAYDAITGDIGLLTASRLQKVPPLLPKGCNEATATARGLVGSYQSAGRSMSTSWGLPPPPPPPPTAPPPKDVYSGRRAPRYKYDEAPASRFLQFAPPQMGSYEPPLVPLDDIVKAQKASGRFELDSNMRQSLAVSLPIGTRESIEGTMLQCSDKDTTEAVDTVMMTKYIETKLDDKKDLLELMVSKANKSVGTATPLAAGERSAADGECRRDDVENEDEDEDKDNCNSIGQSAAKR